MRRNRVQGREARNRIGEGGRGVKKRKKPEKSYRRDVENGGDLGGRRNQRRQESAGSIDVDPEDLENSIRKVEAEREAQDGLRD